MPTDGSLDYVGADAIAGWEWDAANPNTPVVAQLWIDDVELRVLANAMRDDLAAAGKGNGRHAYTILAPFHDGDSHTVRSRFGKKSFTPPAPPATPEPTPSPTIPLAPSPSPKIEGAVRIKLSWDAISSKALAGYRILWGTEPNAPTVKLEAGKATELALFVPPLAPIYFSVLAYDTDGYEGYRSQEIKVPNE